MKTRRVYRSLHEWLDRTGTKQRTLARRAGISEQHISMLLRGSRRCSIRVALRLSSITGVPVEKLVVWPKFQDSEKIAAAAQ